MAGLFTLIFGTVLAGSAIRCGIDNAKMMSKPYRYMKDGTPVYLDRLGYEHVNGEKIVTRYNYQLDRLQDVGERSGRVYYDEEVAKQNRMDAWSDKLKAEAIAEGRLAYLRWYSQCEQELVTEISTGKIIAYLYESESQNIYRKFYLRNMPTSRYSLIKTEPGDFGVPISRKEYQTLNLAFIGTHYGSLNYDMIFLIGTEKDPYRDVHPIDKESEQSVTKEESSQMSWNPYKSEADMRNEIRAIMQEVDEIYKDEDIVTRNNEVWKRIKQLREREFKGAD